MITRKLDLSELMDLQICSRIVMLFGSMIEIDGSGSTLMTLYQIWIVMLG